MLPDKRLKHMDQKQINQQMLAAFNEFSSKMKSLELEASSLMSKSQEQEIEETLAAIRALKNN